MKAIKKVSAGNRHMYTLFCIVGTYMVTHGYNFVYTLHLKEGALHG